MTKREITLKIRGEVLSIIEDLSKRNGNLDFGELFGKFIEANYNLLRGGNEKEYLNALQEIKGEFKKKENSHTTNSQNNIGKDRHTNFFNQLVSSSNYFIYGSWKELGLLYVDGNKQACDSLTGPNSRLSFFRGINDYDGFYEIFPDADSNYYKKHFVKFFCLNMYNLVIFTIIFPFRIFDNRTGARCLTFNFLLKDENEYKYLHNFHQKITVNEFMSILEQVFPDYFNDRYWKEMREGWFNGEELVFIQVLKQ